MCVNRYKEYLVAKEQKTEMLKAIDDKLNECERFNKGHEVADVPVPLLFVISDI